MHFYAAAIDIPFTLRPMHSMPSHDAQVPLADLLRRDGVMGSNAELRPLSGGVSSEIFLIADANPPRVVKRALSTLRVADVWNASISRNEFEQRYLNYVSQFLPDSVPQVLAHGAGYFVMPYFDAAFKTWKSRLLEKDIRLADAEAVGRFLGRVHEHSRDDPNAARLFDSVDNFRELRIDPYLLAVGRRYPELDGMVRAEAARLSACRECLVHGDFSPKNMLLCGSQLVLVDCEVAWYGDSAFDLAFVLSHLYLKALLHAPPEAGWQQLIGALNTHYFDARGPSPDERSSLLKRVATLIPLLLLARVDGKSPVEYLNEQQREAVRSFVVRALLRKPWSDPDALNDDWFHHLDMSFSAA
jgi:aminoglycoside phosphotransferase (APT) family kinase protein